MDKWLPKRKAPPPNDGAFERFITAAIATIITLVFSWRMLDRITIEGKKEEEEYNETGERRARLPSPSLLSSSLLKSSSSSPSSSAALSSSSTASGYYRATPSEQRHATLLALRVASLGNASSRASVATGGVGYQLTHLKPFIRVPVDLPLCGDEEEEGQEDNNDADTLSSINRPNGEFPGVSHGSVSWPRFDSGGNEEFASKDYFSSSQPIDGSDPGVRDAEGDNGDPTHRYQQQQQQQLQHTAQREGRCDNSPPPAIRDNASVTRPDHGVSLSDPSTLHWRPTTHHNRNDDPCVLENTRSQEAATTTCTDQGLDISNEGINSSVDEVEGLEDGSDLFLNLSASTDSDTSSGSVGGSYDLNNDNENIGNNKKHNTSKEGEEEGEDEEYDGRCLDFSNPDDIIDERTRSQNAYNIFSQASHSALSPLYNVKTYDSNDDYDDDVQPRELDSDEELFCCSMLEPIMEEDSDDLTNSSDADSANSSSRSERRFDSHHDSTTNPSVNRNADPGDDYDEDLMYAGGERGTQVTPEASLNRLTAATGSSNSSGSFLLSSLFNRSATPATVVTTTAAATAVGGVSTTVRAARELTHLTTATPVTSSRYSQDPSYSDLDSVGEGLLDLGTNRERRGGGVRGGDSNASRRADYETLTHTGTATEQAGAQPVSRSGSKSHSGDSDSGIGARSRVTGSGRSSANIIFIPSAQEEEEGLRHTGDGSSSSDEDTVSDHGFGFRKERENESDFARKLVCTDEDHFAYIREYGSSVDDLSTESGLGKESPLLGQADIPVALDQHSGRDTRSAGGLNVCDKAAKLEASTEISGVERDRRLPQHNNTNHAQRYQPSPNHFAHTFSTRVDFEFDESNSESDESVQTVITRRSSSDSSTCGSGGVGGGGQVSPTRGTQALRPVPVKGKRPLSDGYAYGTKSRKTDDGFFRDRIVSEGGGVAFGEESGTGNDDGEGDDDDTDSAPLYHENNNFDLRAYKSYAALDFAALESPPAEKKEEVETTRLNPLRCGNQIDDTSSNTKIDETRVVSSLSVDSSTSFPDPVGSPLFVDTDSQPRSRDINKQRSTESGRSEEEGIVVVEGLGEQTRPVTRNADDIIIANQDLESVTVAVGSGNELCVEPDVTCFVQCSSVEDIPNTRILSTPVSQGDTQHSCSSEGMDRAYFDPSRVSVGGKEDRGGEEMDVDEEEEEEEEWEHSVVETFVVPTSQERSILQTLQNVKALLDRRSSNRGAELVPRDGDDNDDDEDNESRSTCTTSTIEVTGHDVMGFLGRRDVDGGARHDRNALARTDSALKDRLGFQLDLDEFKMEEYSTESGWPIVRYIEKERVFVDEHGEDNNAGMEEEDEEEENVDGEEEEEEEEEEKKAVNAQGVETMDVKYERSPSGLKDFRSRDVYMGKDKREVSDDDEEEEEDEVSDARGLGQEDYYQVYDREPYSRPSFQRPSERYTSEPESRNVFVPPSQQGDPHAHIPGTSQQIEPMENIEYREQFSSPMEYGELEFPTKTFPQAPFAEATKPSETLPRRPQTKGMPLVIESFAILAQGREEKLRSPEVDADVDDDDAARYHRELSEENASADSDTRGGEIGEDFDDFLSGMARSTSEPVEEGYVDFLRHMSEPDGTPESVGDDMVVSSLRAPSGSGILSGNLASPYLKSDIFVFPKEGSVAAGGGAPHSSPSYETKHEPQSESEKTTERNPEQNEEDQPRKKPELHRTSTATDENELMGFGAGLRRSSTSSIYDESGNILNKSFEETPSFVIERYDSEPGLSRSRSREGLSRSRTPDSIRESPTPDSLRSMTDSPSRSYTSSRPSMGVSTEPSLDVVLETSPTVRDAPTVSSISSIPEKPSLPAVTRRAETLQQGPVESPPQPIAWTRVIPGSHFVEEKLSPPSDRKLEAKPLSDSETKVLRERNTVAMERANSTGVGIPMYQQVDAAPQIYPPTPVFSTERSEIKLIEHGPKILPIFDKSAFRQELRDDDMSGLLKQSEPLIDHVLNKKEVQKEIHEEEKEEEDEDDEEEDDDDEDDDDDDDEDDDDDDDEEEETEEEEEEEEVEEKEEADVVGDDKNAANAIVEVKKVVEPAARPIAMDIRTRPTPSQMRTVSNSQESADDVFPPDSSSPSAPDSPAISSDTDIVPATAAATAAAPPLPTTAASPAAAPLPTLTLSKSVPTTPSSKSAASPLRGSAWAHSQFVYTTPKKPRSMKEIKRKYKPYKSVLTQELPPTSPKAAPFVLPDNMITPSRSRIIYSRNKFLSEQNLLSDNYAGEFAAHKDSLLVSPTVHKDRAYVQRPLSKNPDYRSQEQLEKLKNMVNLSRRSESSLYDKSHVDCLHEDCILSEKGQRDIIDKTLSIDNMHADLYRHLQRFGSEGDADACAIGENNYFPETNSDLFDLTFPLQDDPYSRALNRPASMSELRHASDYTTISGSGVSDATFETASMSRGVGGKTGKGRFAGHQQYKKSKSLCTLETNLDDDNDDLRFATSPSDLHGGLQRRVPSAHELRISKSLQKLNVPNWYKDSSLSKSGSCLLKYGSSSTMSSFQYSPSLISSPCTTPSSSSNVVIRSRVQPPTSARNLRSPRYPSSSSAPPYSLGDSNSSSRNGATTPTSTRLPSENMRAKEKSKSLMPIPIVPFAKIRAMFEKKREAAAASSPPSGVQSSVSPTHQPLTSSATSNTNVTPTSSISRADARSPPRSIPMNGKNHDNYNTGYEDDVVPKIILSPSDPSVKSILKKPNPEKRYSDIQEAPEPHEEDRTGAPAIIRPIPTRPSEQTPTVTISKSKTPQMSTAPSNSASFAEPPVSRTTVKMPEASAPKATTLTPTKPPLQPKPVSRTETSPGLPKSEPSSTGPEKEKFTNLKKSKEDEKKKKQQQPKEAPVPKPRGFSFFKSLRSSSGSSSEDVKDKGRKSPGSSSSGAQSLNASYDSADMFPASPVTRGPIQPSYNSNKKEPVTSMPPTILVTPDAPSPPVRAEEKESPRPNQERPDLRTAPVSVRLEEAPVVRPPPQGPSIPTVLADNGAQQGRYFPSSSPEATPMQPSGPSPSPPSSLSSPSSSTPATSTAVPKQQQQRSFHPVQETNLDDSFPEMSPTLETKQYPDEVERRIGSPARKEVPKSSTTSSASSPPPAATARPSTPPKVEPEPEKKRWFPKAKGWRSSGKSPTSPTEALPTREKEVGKTPGKNTKETRKEGPASKPDFELGKMSYEPRRLRSSRTSLDQDESFNSNKSGSVFEEGNRSKSPDTSSYHSLDRQRRQYSRTDSDLDRSRDSYGGSRAGGPRPRDLGRDYARESRGPERKSSVDSERSFTRDLDRVTDRYASRDLDRGPIRSSGRGDAPRMPSRDLDRSTTSSSSAGREFSPREGENRRGDSRDRDVDSSVPSRRPISGDRNDKNFGRRGEVPRNNDDRWTPADRREPSRDNDRGYSGQGYAPASRSDRARDDRDRYEPSRRSERDYSPRDAPSLPSSPPSQEPYHDRERRRDNNGDLDRSSASRGRDSRDLDTSRDARTRGPHSYAPADPQRSRSSSFDPEPAKPTASKWKPKPRGARLSDASDGPGVAVDSNGGHSGTSPYRYPVAGSAFSASRPNTVSGLNTPPTPARHDSKPVSAAASVTSEPKSVKETTV